MLTRINLAHILREGLNCNNYVYAGINRYLHDNIVNNFYFTNSENVIIEIAVPAMVVEELEHQQNMKFNQNLTKLKEMSKKFVEIDGFSFEFPEIDYQKHINSKMDAYLGKYNIKKIPNVSGEVFEKFIRRAVDRKSPFYKKKNDVDSGFKDTVIWESILKFVSDNHYDKYFFLTSDYDFNDCLDKEFFELTGKNLLFVKEVADLKGSLEEEIEGTKKINNSLHVIEKELPIILKDLVAYNYLVVKNQNEEFEISDIVGHEILDINFYEGCYWVSVSININYWSPYSRYNFQPGVDLSNTMHEEGVMAEVSLVFNENFNLKKISSYDILIDGDVEINF